jgi:hypothetical protein
MDRRAPPLPQVALSSLRFRAVAAFALLALQSFVFTAETTVFGPKIYRRGTGGPVTITHTFRVANALHRFTLRVENHDVTSAVIGVNGQTVLGPSMFKGDGLLASPIALHEGDNTIAVEVRSQPDSWLSVTIVAEMLPTVTALTPAQLTVEAGGTGTLAVNIQNPDLKAPTRVALTSSNPSVVLVPREVDIPAGATQGTRRSRQKSHVHATTRFLDGGSHCGRKIKQVVCLRTEHDIDAGRYLLGDGQLAQ